LKSYPTNKEDCDAKQYLENVGERFMFDVASGIYKPKAYYKEKKPSRLQELWKNFREHWAAILINALTLAAVATYTHWAQKQWTASNRAAGAAESAAKTAASELEMSERPWVDADISIDGPFDFDVNGANIRLKIA